MTRCYEVRALLNTEHGNETQVAEIRVKQIEQPNQKTKHEGREVKMINFKIHAEMYLWIDRVGDKHHPRESTRAYVEVEGRM